MSINNSSNEVKANYENEAEERIALGIEFDELYEMHNHTFEKLKGIDKRMIEIFDLLYPDMEHANLKEEIDKLDKIIKVKSYLQNFK